MPNVTQAMLVDEVHISIDSFAITSKIEQLEIPDVFLGSNSCSYRIRCTFDYEKHHSHTESLRLIIRDKPFEAVVHIKKDFLILREFRSNSDILIRFNDYESKSDFFQFQLLFDLNGFSFDHVQKCQEIFKIVEKRFYGEKT